MLLSLFKKPRIHKVLYVFLLVVQIYVVYSYLVLLVRALYVCGSFYSLYVLITLFVGAKTKRFTFRLHFVDLLENIET